MFGSLPSAIFLFKSVASVSPDAAVIPVINTNQTVTIAAELVDGETIVGQCAISHPTEPPAIVRMGSPVQGMRSLPGELEPLPTIGREPSIGRSSSIRLRTHFRRDSRTFDTTPMDSPVDSGRGASVDTDLRGNIGYRKGEEEVPLPSRIYRLFYINLYGQVGP